MNEKPLVLIADDEDQIRDVVKMKLESEGFEVAEASNGQEAIDKIKDLKPTIVILDVVMPGMDGVETLLKLKESPLTSKTKIFMFTGKGDPRADIVEVNRRFAQESGAVDFIRKEVDLDELAKRLKKTIEDLKQEEEFQKNKEKLAQ